MAATLYLREIRGHGLPLVILKYGGTAGTDVVLPLAELYQGLTFADGG